MKYVFIQKICKAPIGPLFLGRVLCLYINFFWCLFGAYANGAEWHEVIKTTAIEDFVQNRQFQSGSHSSLSKNSIGQLNSIYTDFMGHFAVDGSLPIGGNGVLLNVCPCTAALLSVQIDRVTVLGWVMSQIEKNPQRLAEGRVLNLT